MYGNLSTRVHSDLINGDGWFEAGEECGAEKQVEAANFLLVDKVDI